jgi:hypothetical protein
MGFTDTTDGSNSLSQLTFGDDAPARPAFGNGLAYNGRDAAIFRGGEYYIAVAGPGVAPSTTATSGQLWGHTSTSTTSGTIDLRLTNVPFPTPAGGTGTAVTIVEGQSGLLRVTTTPGANPVSSATSVVVDTSLIGGTAGVVLVDDGTNGDVNAGDGIFSRAITVNVAQQAVQQLPFVVTDSVGRTSTGSIAATISARRSAARRARATAPAAPSSGRPAVYTSRMGWTASGSTGRRHACDTNARRKSGAQVCRRSSVDGRFGSNGPSSSK